MRHWLLGLLILVLAGCATTVPEGVRRAPPEDPALRSVLPDPQRFVGQEARWGGTIAGVDNRADQTCVEVVGRELQRDGRPLDTDRSEGRFLACVDGFLDPAIFSEGRTFTARGVIEGSERRPVGEFAYRYPVLRVSSYQLWAPLPDPRERAWDPYWDPFWHGPWPYRFHDPFYRPFHRPYW